MQHRHKAGLTASNELNSAKLCLDWGPQVPYTKRSLADPIQHLPGKLPLNISSLTQKARGLTHGVVTITKSTAKESVHPKQGNSLLQELVDRRERNYHRKEHHELGKSRSVINAQLPELVNKPDFKFGRVTKLGEPVAKMMHPEVSAPESQEIHRRYVLSHGSYLPGERRTHYEQGWTPPAVEDAGVANRLNSDGSRVKNSLYWKEDREQELHNQLSSARVAHFRDGHQPELGKVHDPIKDTMAHLPPDHTFGIKAKQDEMGVCELVGNTHQPPCSRERLLEIKKKPAGLQTHHTDDLDQQKHIVPQLTALEDRKLARKITEDVIGGTVLRKVPLDLKRVFGVPTVRDPKGRIGRGQKKLADSTNYGDELGAKGLMYPTPRNVYGLEQLQVMEQQLQKYKYAKAALA
ncbi:hypothetical protein EDD86DRAFT_275961 [Gorgonomyces haynaldii]|nr:hypothetical protein EDD86DRAFT_275961 [Gorgonomyces haynaldii]